MFCIFFLVKRTLNRFLKVGVIQNLTATDLLTLLNSCFVLAKQVVSIFLKRTYNDTDLENYATLFSCIVLGNTYSAL